MMHTAAHNPGSLKRALLEPLVEAPDVAVALQPRLPGGKRLKTTTRLAHFGGRVEDPRGALRFGLPTHTRKEAGREVLSAPESSEATPAPPPPERHRGRRGHAAPEPVVAVPLELPPPALAPPAAVDAEEVEGVAEVEVEAGAGAAALVVAVAGDAVAEVVVVAAGVVVVEALAVVVVVVVASVGVGAAAVSKADPASGPRPARRTTIGAGGNGRRRAKGWMGQGFQRGRTRELQPCPLHEATMNV